MLDVGCLFCFVLFCFVMANVCPMSDQISSDLCFDVRCSTIGSMELTK